MKTPKFIKDARVSAKARTAMEVGTRFANTSIDPSLSSKDILGCLKLACESNHKTWFLLRLHSIYNKRRMLEERAQLVSFDY